MLLANHPNGISNSDFLGQEDMDAFDRASQEDLEAAAHHARQACECCGRPTRECECLGPRPESE